LGGEIFHLPVAKNAFYLSEKKTRAACFLFFVNALKATSDSGQPKSTMQVTKHSQEEQQPQRIEGGVYYIFIFAQVNRDYNDKNCFISFI
jgi:hypothetical protein